LSKITVAIDCQALLGNIQTGLGVYALNLVEVLENFRESLKVVRLSPPGNKPLRTTPQRLLWEQTRLPWLIARSDCDVFHSPALSLPVIGSRKKVATAHDLIILKHPEMMTGLARKYFAEFIPRTLQKADHIIANSEATKKDLMRYLHIPAGKITVIHLGVGKEFLKESDRDLVNTLRRANHITGDYLLSVASFEPRKNHTGIIRGFAKALPDLPAETKLALVGRENKYQREMRALVEELQLTDRVAFCGYLGTKELAAMYQAAVMLVFPSLEEGFGLPIIEAFAKGVPVLTSRLEATEEVGGDAVKYVNPQRADEIGQAIAELYNDKELRQSLIEKGKQRVQLFSWENNAKETIKVYYRVLGRTKDLK